MKRIRNGGLKTEGNGNRLLGERKFDGNDGYLSIGCQEAEGKKFTKAKEVNDGFIFTDDIGLGGKDAGTGCACYKPT